MKDETQDMGVPPSGSGSRPTDEAASCTASPPEASVPNAVWVIVRLVGEYSARIETPIRYCLSEEEAEAAIARIDVERQRDPKPPYRHVQDWAYQLPDGTLLPDSTDFMDPRIRGDLLKPVPKPNAAEIRAQNEEWERERKAAVGALNHVDPEGSWYGDDYYYERVTLWTASAGEAGTAETPKSGSVHERAVGESGDAQRRRS